MHDIIYLCPSTPRGACNWEGYQNEVVSHFEDNHTEHLLDTNSLDIDVTSDNEVHYLMNAFNETYLIQIKYLKCTETVELRIRYLGADSKAAKIFYYVEVMCGNFGFTSKSSGNGFEAVTVNNGTVYIDVQAIKVTCGRRLLDTLVAWIYIENEVNRYTHKSLRRKQYDNRSLEAKTRESFKRLSSYRTSMRKRSIEGIETVQAINRIIQRKTSSAETPEEYQKFIIDIVDEIFRDAMDEVDFKEYVLVNLESSSESTAICDGVNCNTEETIPGNIEHKEAIVEETVNTDVVKYRSQEDFTNPVNGVVRENDLEKLTTSESEGEQLTGNHTIAQYQKVIVLKSNENLTIKIDLPAFQEDVVSSVEVATHQIADTEYIEDGDIEDLRHCEWLLNGITPDRPRENENNRKQNRLSQAEELYLSNLERIKCQSCHIIMTPPIFMCSEGHSVCSTCKSLNCGICGIEVTDITNMDLEEISRYIAHPCRFAERGCTEVHNCHEIRRHEVYCDYFKYKCPICCLNVGKYYDIKAHIRLLHPSTKIVEECYHPFPRNSDFVFANKYGIFHCTAPLKVNSIEWTVSFCGREPISFVCKVKVTGKKNGKVYTLQRHENGYKSVIFLDELKSLRLKDKNAVLVISEC